jgi:hypothetical protein
VSSPVLASHQVLDQIGDRHQTLLVQPKGVEAVFQRSQ